MGKIINGSQLGIKVVAESKKEYSDSDYDKVFDFSKEWVNSFRKSHGVASNFDYADLREAVVKKFGYTDFTNEKLNSAIQEGWGDAEQDVELKTEDSLTNYETAVFANQLKDEEVGLENNTTMKQLDLNMKMLEKSLKVAKSSFIPTLSMSFSYNYQSLYNPNINFFEYNWSNSSSLMFNLSIPLYKASNFTKVKSARIQMRQLDWNRIDTERQLNMQIVSCRNNMSASTEQVVSNKENVMQAKKAVVIAEKRYDVGKGTVLELNSSQVSLTQAQLTYNQSIYDYLVAKADLDQVLGKE